MPDTIRGTAPRNGLPERKNYVYRGTGASEPPEVAAARLRHKAIDAEIERRTLAAIAASDTAGPGPDDLGYEWRREQLAEAEPPPDPAPAVPAQRTVAAPPPVSLAEWQWCGGCGYLTSCCRCTAGPGDDEVTVITETVGHYQAAQAALDRQPEPAPLPAAEPGRCRKCGYLKTSAGHRVMCHA